nr:MAG TPA: hypothetical protein [Bacteriophage sp.]
MWTTAIPPLFFSYNFLIAFLLFGLIRILVHLQ